MAAASVLLRACGLAMAGMAGASEDAIAMVQGRLSLLADPKVEQAIEALGPFAVSSDTVAARLPDSKAGNAAWAEDQFKGISARGFSKDGLQAGALVVGGGSKEQGHAFVNMGYTGLKDPNNPKTPNSGSLMGAAKVTPQNMELIGALPSKDGTVEYAKIRTALASGHLTPAQISSQWGHIFGLEEPATKRAPEPKLVGEEAKKQQQAHRGAEEASAKQSMEKAAAEKAAAEKAAAEKAIVERAMEQAGAQWAKEHRKEQETAKAAAKYAFEQAAAKKAVEDAAARKALEQAAAQAEAVKRAEQEAAAKNAVEDAARKAMEQAAAQAEAVKRAEQEAAAKQAAEQKAAEWAAKKRAAEEAAQARKVQQEALAKHAADQKQATDWAAAAQGKKAEQEALPQERPWALLQTEPDALDYLHQLLGSSQEQHASASKAFGDWVKQHADAAWGKNKDAAEGQTSANVTKSKTSKAMGDWIKKHADAIWGKTKSEEKGQEGAKEMKSQAFGDWLKKNADAAWGKSKPGAEGQEVGDWLKKQAEATFGKKKAQEQVAGATKALSDFLKGLGNATQGLTKPAASAEAPKNKAFSDWLKSLSNASKPAASPEAVGDALQAIGQAVKHAAEHPPSAKQGTPTLQDILGSLSKAAAGRPAALLQRGAEISQAEEAEEEEEGLQPKATDMAEEHRKASEAANEAVRKIASAKAKMSKALQTIQKGKKRITVLEEENATAVAKWERAHAKRMQYTDQAVSYRLKQAEREGLKGKHLKFDKATYLQRVKNGNFSTYGLWQTFDTKQHFGEKTWDILSNHIFGLDKFMKFLYNATEVETKAKRYLKLEKHYNAMGAAAQEELLELSANIEQAEKDIEQAKEDVSEATTAKSDLKAMKKEAKKMLVKEKASKTASRKRAHKAKKTKKGHEEEVGSEEEANDEEEQASEEAEGAEEEQEEEASEDGLEETEEEAEDAAAEENQEENEEQGEEESEEEGLEEEAEDAEASESTSNEDTEEEEAER